jgi:hypothetical protein
MKTQGKASRRIQKQDNNLARRKTTTVGGSNTVAVTNTNQLSARDKIEFTTTFTPKGSGKVRVTAGASGVDGTGSTVVGMQLAVNGDQSQNFIGAAGAVPTVSATGFWSGNLDFITQLPAGAQATIYLIMTEAAKTLTVAAGAAYITVEELS